MPLSARIFLLYGLFVGLSGYFILKFVSDQINPGVRQSTEETLVDMANALAELLHDEVRDGTLSQGRWATILQNYGRQRPLASIWGVEKTGVSHRVYVTDRNGIMLVDSMGEVVGQDYSHWNDEYRTLRGQYNESGFRFAADYKCQLRRWHWQRHCRGRESCHWRASHDPVSRRAGLRALARIPP